MSSIKDMEKDLLALSEQYGWATGDEQARADVRRRYRALHARWMEARGLTGGEPVGRQPDEPEDPETLF